MKTSLACLQTVLAFSVAFSATGSLRYVDANSANPIPPYTDWSTAAITIQDAVDVSSAGDEIVVTNGIYSSGGRAVYSTVTNRVAVDRAVLIRSANGAQFSFIQGSTNGNSPIRCVYLTNG